VAWHHNGHGDDNLHNRQEPPDDRDGPLRGRAGAGCGGTGCGQVASALQLRPAKPGQLHYTLPGHADGLALPGIALSAAGASGLPR